MAQFGVYRNSNPDTSASFPYLLDIQSNLLETLATRVAVPLSPASAWDGEVIRKLMPVLEVNGEPFVMIISQLAGVPKRISGAQVADVAGVRTKIIAAVDFVLAEI